jgi:predicted flap endonuclease-1-like 5' DNA nuclease
LSLTGPRAPKTHRRGIRNGVNMDNRTLLIIFIVLILTAAFLFAWMRRDRGKEPIDRLPEALSEPLDRRSGPGPASPTIVHAPVAVATTATDLPPAPTIRPAPEGPPDDLSRMKGVGPKLVALLRDLGVTHFSQIAAWTDEDVAAIDQHLGAFKGRITRDRWVEQARRLAADDVSGFEAEFGKLG